MVTAAEPKDTTVAEVKPVVPTPVTRPAVAVVPPARPTPPPTQPVVEAKQPDPTPVAEASKPAPDKPVAKAVGKANREVYFALGAAKANTSVLDSVVKWMNGSPDVSIIVEGHADPSGSADANMALSQQRAEFVRDFLVSAGIDASRIEVAPFGSSRLKYSKVDNRNRRAAIVVK
jgi:peptidoglycan-associated lipoprotein